MSNSEDHPSLAQATVQPRQGLPVSERLIQEVLDTDTRDKLALLKLWNSLEELMQELTLPVHGYDHHPKPSNRP